MALHLFRRHRLECEAGFPEDSRTGEFDERKKGWKRCACLLFASGTLGGRFKRKHTGKADWEQARAVVATWEAADTWEDPAPASPTAPPVPIEPPPPPARDPARISLVDAGKVFLASRKGKQLKTSTLSKYRTFITQVTAFATARGYVFVDQFTITDVDVFYATWALGPRTKGKRLSTLRAYFRFCRTRKWLAENPVSDDVKPPIGANRAANKAPFSDDELERILAACDAVRVDWKNQTGTGTWTGEEVKDLIWLMLFTGYRISDAVFFDIGRLEGNQIFIRAKKNGGDVFAYVPDWLRDRLHARARRCGRRPFIIQSERLETATNNWRRRLARVFEQAGTFDEPATPHRFRHTFIRILLQRGVPIADVADLTGDDEATIRRHYGRWVPERQARLTRILQDAFSDKPKLALIHGGRT